MVQARKERRKAGGATGVANPSADLMYRLMSNNAIQLSQMADNKAHIMITISAGIIGLSIGHLFDPRLVYATVALMLTCLLTLAFGVYTTMPRLRTQRRADLRNPRFNILFFGDFVRLPYERFQSELDEIVPRPQQVYHVIARDVYALGTLLAEKKYRYLSYAYRTFLTGFILSALILLVTLLVVRV